MRKAPLLLILLLGICDIGLGQGFGVRGTVRDKNTLKPLSGAVVSMIGSDGSVVAYRTDTGGHYKIDSARVKPNTSYIVSADARDMLYLGCPDKVNITTKDITPPKIFQADFVLQKQHHERGFPRVNFAYNSTTVTQGIKDTVLVYLVKLLNDNPTIVIQVDAHASPDEGTSDIKMKLSTARAEACKAYVVSQGIDSARVKAKGWGDTQPLRGCTKADIAKMKTKEEKIVACEADRRAEFRVLSFNYKPHFSAKGVVIDSKTRKPIAGALIQKVGSDGSVNYIKTDASGHYIFDTMYFKQSTSYIISASAENYFSNPSGNKDKSNICTVGINTSKVFTDTFKLKYTGTFADNLLPSIPFDEGSSELTESANDSLSKMHNLLLFNSNLTIEIDTHVSENEGTEEQRQKLSLARANACINYMTSFGIEPERMTVKGWNDTEKNKKNDATNATNHLTYFRILSFKYKPKEIKGSPGKGEPIYNKF